MAIQQDVRAAIYRAIDRGRDPLRRARRNYHQRKAGRYCVELRSPWHGFFAQLEWIVEILAYADETNRDAQIRLTGSQYVTPARGPDFLRYFFEPLQPEQPLPRKFWHQIGDIKQLQLPRGYDRVLTFDRAHALFFGYVRLRDDVVAEIDAIATSLFAGAPTLGIHYRGTDKRSEADRVPYERMTRAIDAELARAPADAKLFVATDEQAFLDLCLARYGQRVVSLPDHRRSTDDRPVHIYPDGDGYALGRDALFNCLMLARCDRALKTASILSAWAKVINPTLDLRTLSRRDAKHSYFPERAIPDYVFDEASGAEGAG